MAGGSTLDPDNFPDPSSPDSPNSAEPVVAPDIGPGVTPVPKGSDTRSLGPSDSTDTGSDFASGSPVSPAELVSDTDAEGTGERAGVGRKDDETGEDIGFDKTVDAGKAALGTGLDEAELARQQK